MKLCLILGTRPEIIKMSPLINLIKKRNLSYFIIHTNQHYSDNMDAIFFKDLCLELPRYNLNVGSSSHANQTAKMMINIESILLDERPDVVLVQGDTNTVLAGALTSSKCNIPVAHVEAGLRSYDRCMPEEINRVVVDHLSNYLFCPTKIEFDICKNEAIEDSKLFITGNTIVDAVKQNVLKSNSRMIDSLELNKKEYVLLTMHRSSNVDTKEMLQKQLQNVSKIGLDKNLPVLFPIHPRTKNNVAKFNIILPKNIITIDPVGYLDMLNIINNAKIIFTDSGGIIEEACILGTPTINLRENTERPQAVDVGACIVVGSDVNKMNKAYELLIKRTNWKNPFGDGNTCDKILNILQNW